MPTSSSDHIGQHETQFATEPRLRRLHYLQSVGKLAAVVIATFIVMRLVRGRAIFPIPIYLWAFAIGLPSLISYLRMAWGTSVVFRETEMVLFRGSSVVCRIPRSGIQKFQRKKDVFAFHFVNDGTIIRPKIIGREGFAPDIWQRLGDYATSYFSQISILPPK